jgi:predicted PurR-regulated permease PerM
VLKLLLSLLTPFVIAFVLAYIFSPLVNFLEVKLKFKRIFALLITYGFLILLLASFVLFTDNIIISSLDDMINQLPL